MASRDPRAETVRSVLVRLRTRSGLTADRLRSTEVDIQPITELPVVSQLVAGSAADPAGAVVEAVRRIATQLRPTDLVIVDAALALGLLRDRITDPGSADRLYAEDLRDRRDQLVALWSALHELLGVQDVPQAPTVRALRTSLEPRALGRLASRAVASTSLDPLGLAGVSPPAGDQPAGSPAVVIIGAAVMDRIHGVDVIPAPGTSAQASSFDQHPGGKGLNQAVACARLGLSANLVAPVGEDGYGDRIVAYLEHEGVPTNLIKQAPAASTPFVNVYVTPSGDSSAVAWMNEAHVRLEPEDVRRLHTTIRSASAVLLTFEPAADAVRTVFEIMSAVPAGTIFVVHPSPTIHHPQVLYQHFSRVDYVVGTPWELQGLLPESPTELTVDQIITQLLLLGVGGVCVIDRFGCVIRSDRLNEEIPRFPTALQDTPGARDAFLAAFTRRLIAANGEPAKEDLVWATAAMAAAQTVGGIPSSMPTVGDVDRVLTMTNEEHAG